MGVYRKFILPRLIDAAMRDKAVAARRAELIPKAAGAVLEIGIGSGLNLPLYPSAITHLTGVDPSAELLSMARRKLTVLPFPVDLFCQSAEELPFDDRSFDTAVVTWTLCSITNPMLALAEVKRVLRSDGRLLFVEHGLSSDPKVQVWQHRLTPLWKRIGGGCHLNRKIDDLISNAGFRVAELKTDYLPGPRPMTYTYQGIAELSGTQKD
ncbi:MAG TPA: class I SAM-dependent methyltransferase [Terriglobia bacterium]|nr:class I SAM-dependent methyltransferase [Terriglobia bacterium]